MTDNDSPWKEMLEEEMPLALAFFFPKVHADLDWGRDYESLDQELRKLDPGGATGKRILDRLVKTWTHGGDARYLHIEVQGARERGFAKRMYDYNVRCEQHLGQPVASFAILIDTHPRWRPRTYTTEVYGTTHRFRFVPVKILGWEGREDELRADANSVAVFVLAQLAALRTKRDRERRTEAKLDLVLRLLDRRMEADDFRRWYRYLDWLLWLPKEYDERIYAAIVQKEKEKAVPYVTYFERRGLEKGMEKGREEGLLEGMKRSIEAVLEVRFPQEARSLMPAVKQESEMAELDRLLQLVKRASLEEVRAALQQRLAE